MWIAMVVLILHMGCMLLLYSGWKPGRKGRDSRIFQVMCWIPFTGEATVILVEAAQELGWLNPRRIGGDMRKKKEEHVSSLQGEESLKDELIVPAEEAFLINDTRLRRSLILDLLRKNPSQYVRLLQEAQMNDDVDVVHYASTAIMELNSDYDLRLQNMEQRFTQKPDSPGVLAEYITLLGEYLDQRLVEGRRLILLQRQYSELLQKSISQKPVPEDYEKLIENEMDLGEYTQSHTCLMEMMNRWPDTELPWLLLIRYYAKQKQGKKIQEVIRNIKKKHIYLSPRGKEVIGFWSLEN
ncbi:MAG: hypothetical protein PHG16_00080 [Lachnospiraceae bacterium]|nr:hypothetical protein [Lachnospiraceae bacterium]